MDTHKQEGVQVYVVCFSKQNTMNLPKKKKTKQKQPSLFQKCSASHQQAETYEQSFWEKM